MDCPIAANKVAALDRDIAKDDRTASSGYVEDLARTTGSFDSCDRNVERLLTGAGLSGLVLVLHAHSQRDARAVLEGTDVEDASMLLVKAESGNLEIVLTSGVSEWEDVRYEFPEALLRRTG